MHLATYLYGLPNAFWNVWLRCAPLTAVREAHLIVHKKKENHEENGIGKQGYSNGQFYAPFVIQFGDGERWLIYSTSTLRDRIKMYQWDAYNIKDIDSHVTKAYFDLSLRHSRPGSACIRQIAATADRRIIGDLPSGGAPKTDIIMTAKMNDGTEVVKTISCKRVTGDTVSAHQYKADEYARVLDPANEQLRLYLNYFQTAGNFRDMPEHAEQTLAKLLAPYLEKLCYWVVGGNGGGGDAGQIVSHVVAYRPEDNAFSVHSVDEYVHWLLTKCRPKRGGTPFGWTYQGERGSNIQLKMPVFFA